MVARNMTITCDRWTQIAFSTEYYRSGQKILVRKGSKATIARRPGRASGSARPTGTSSMANLKKLAPEAIAVGADNHTGCLVLFQQGEVDADHRRRHGAGRPGRPGPVRGGAGSEGVHRRAVRAGVQRKATSTWSGSSTPCWPRCAATVSGPPIYDRWLAEPLGPAPSPPEGRLRQDTREPRRPRAGRVGPAPAAPGRMGVAVEPEPAADLPRPSSATGATPGGPSWTQLDQAALSVAERSGRHQRHRLVDGAVEGRLRPLRAAAGGLGLRPGRADRAGAAGHA